MRQILVDLHDVKNYFDAQDHSVPAADSLRNGLFNLTRMWWQP